MTKFSLHVATGPRDGYGPVVEAAPAVVFAVDEGGSLLEAAEKSGGRTITIFRTTEVYGDAPPNIDHMTEAQARAAADFHWPALMAKYRLDRADYYQVTNELGGDNPTTLRNLVAFETRLMELAEGTGIHLAVGSCAGGSPGDWDLWVEYFVPLIRRAAQGGHIYSRHAYGGVVPGSSGYLTTLDGLPADDNAGRPFREAEYLRANGILTPMVITEAGQFGGFQFPGIAAFIVDIARYDALCRQHPNIWGFCAWTYGQYLSFPANIEAASGAMAAYLIDEGGAVRPAYPDPAIIDEEEPMPETWHVALWDLSITRQIASGVSLNPNAGLQRAMFADGFVPVLSEGRYTDPAGKIWAYQPAETVDGSLPRRIYLAPAPNWTPVTWITDPRQAPPPSGITDGFDPPIGTATERAGAAVWPGTWVDANPYGRRYEIRTGVYHYHTGSDLNNNSPAWDSDRLAPVYATANGVVTFAAVRSDWGGYIVVVRHALPGGETVYSRSAHLNDILVAAGQQVTRGQQIGRIGRSANNGPYHLHFDISPTAVLLADAGDWPGATYSRILRDYVDPRLFILDHRPATAPAPPPPTPPTPGVIDLLPYFLPVPGGNGPLYELRRVDGSQERVQIQSDGAWFYVVKGTGGRDGRSEWEQLRADADYIYRALDTSPGGGLYYWQRDPNSDAARWCPRRMYPGQTWVGGLHNVQFYSKTNCQPVEVPWNGQATNRVTFIAHHAAWQSPYGLVFNDVIEIGDPAGEVFGFARGIGMVFWRAPWNSSALAELHAPGARPDNIRESLC